MLVEVWETWIKKKSNLFINGKKTVYAWEGFTSQEAKTNIYISFLLDLEIYSP